MTSDKIGKRRKKGGGGEPQQAGKTDPKGSPDKPPGLKAELWKAGHKSPVLDMQEFYKSMPQSSLTEKCSAGRIAKGAVKLQYSQGQDSKGQSQLPFERGRPQEAQDSENSHAAEHPPICTDQCTCTDPRSI